MLTYIGLGLLGLIVLWILILVFAKKPTIDEIHVDYLNDVGNAIKTTLKQKFDNADYFSYEDTIALYNQHSSNKLHDINEVKNALYNDNPRNPKSIFVQKTKDYMKELIDKLHRRYEIEKCAFSGLTPEQTIKTHEIQIKDNEIYYTLFSGVGLFYEKRITTSYNYGGLRMTTNLGGGVRYTSGSLNVMKNTANVLDLVGTGDIYITNKRIIFSNWEKGSNKTINIGDILDFEVFQEAVLIGVSNGKKPYIKFPKTRHNELREDEILFVKIINRIIQGTIEQGEHCKSYLSETDLLLQKARELRNQS